MAEPQEVVIVDRAGTEHHFPAGFDPKRAAAIVQAQSPPIPPASTTGPTLGDVRMGLTDAEGRIDPAVARLSPAAQEAYRNAKGTAADVGIGAGLLGAGGIGAAVEPELATGLVKGLGQAGLGIGAYKALTALGINPEFAGAVSGLVSGAGLKKTLGDAMAARGARIGNMGGRLVAGEGLPPEQVAAEALAALRQPTRPNTVTLPSPAELPPGYTPRTSGLRVTGRIIVPSPSGAAAVEAASLDPRISNLDQPPPARPTFKSPPDAYTRVLQRESAIPRLEDLKATTASPTSADTPRDWHSGATDSPLAQRMQAAHKVIMDEDARYRAATAGERAMFQAMPKTYKDALLASLLTPQ